MLKRKFYTISAYIVTALLSPWIYAQDIDALSIKIGDADLIPTLRFEYIRNSNAFLNNTDEIETAGILASPRVTLVAERRLLKLAFGYQGNYASFEEENLNYDDHALFANANAEFSSKTRLSALFEIAKTHEELGTGATQGTAFADSEQIDQVNTKLDSKITYGASNAKGNIAAGFFLFSRSYQNRSDVTAGTDYVELTPYGEFSYRLSADSRLLLQLRYRNLDFDANERDRSELQVLTGFSFRGTGKLGGEAKVGAAISNYSDSLIEDTNYLTAAIDMYYSPTTFSRINLIFSRDLNNTDIITAQSESEQTIDDKARLLWSHRWSSRIFTRAVLGVENRNRDCPTIPTTTITGGLELGIKPRRWFEFGAYIDGTSRTADNCFGNEAASENLEYERQKVGLFTKITL